MKVISIMTACFNEEDNVEALYKEVKSVFATMLPEYRYEHLFIDNCSADRTVEILRKIAAEDPNVKVIVNSRNFGHIRSPFHGLLQCHGDAVVSVVADLQDPPVLIPQLVKRWEEGYKIVVAQKKSSAELPLFFLVRKVYYRLVSWLSEVELINNFTGFGLYDKSVMDILRTIKDPYPYFRGLICDLGFKKAIVPYDQPIRKRGITKNNFYTLYDMAMLGITQHSKVPLRIATIFGFSLGFISLLFAILYLVVKLLFWNQFSMGMAPLIIGLFFFSSIQLFFIGMIGEYVGNIHTIALNRPIVVEKERINC